MTSTVQGQALTAALKPPFRSEAFRAAILVTPFISSRFMVSPSHGTNVEAIMDTGTAPCRAISKPVARTEDACPAPKGAPDRRKRNAHSKAGVLPRFRIPT